MNTTPVSDMSIEQLLEEIRKGDSLGFSHEEEVIRRISRLSLACRQANAHIIAVSNGLETTFSTEEIVGKLDDAVIIGEGLTRLALED